MGEQHPVKPLPFPYDALEGISEQVTRWHHDKIYAAYVERLNEIIRKLQVVDRSEVNPLQSEFNDLKRAELRTRNGMRLHELYWDGLGPEGGNPAGTRIHERIRDEFGSFDAWGEDFTACARSAEAWGVLAYDTYRDKLRNIVIDEDFYGFWGAVPLIVIDMAEHAYYYDHGPKRGAYIEAFLANIDWKTVDKRYIPLAQE